MVPVLLYHDCVQLDPEQLAEYHVDDPSGR
jgi:hypothetical protein